jgi:hypothetical protein
MRAIKLQHNAALAAWWPSPCTPSVQLLGARVTAEDANTQDGFLRMASLIHLVACDPSDDT